MPESPKGTVRLYPAEERQDGPPFGGSLGDELEEMRMNEEKSRRRVRAVALRLAYHVTKTPQDFVTDQKPTDDQAWSVMPDVPSSSSAYKPVSRHKSRDDAVRALKSLDKKDLTEKLQKKQETTEPEVEQAPVQEPQEPQSKPQEPQLETQKKPEPVIRALPPKRMQEPAEDNGDFETPPEPPEPVQPVIRAKPPEGMKPEEQAEEEPKRRGER